MSLEHHPARNKPENAADLDGAARGPPDDADYWHALIDEKAAADFLGVTARSMQKWRQTGGGCRYIALSSRCLRYRRIDLRDFALARLRKSTCDPGQAAA